MSQQLLDVVQATAIQYIQELNNDAGTTGAAANLLAGRDLLIRTVLDAFLTLSREHNRIVQINQLPVDIFIQIASYLDIREICNAMTVCSLWNQVLAEAHTLWSIVYLKIDMVSPRVARFLGEIAQRAESAPLSVHLRNETGIKIFGHPPHFKAVCIVALKLIMHRLRRLAIEDDLHLWTEAVGASAPGLEVLHLRALIDPYEHNPLHWDDTWFGNGHLPNLRAIHLANVHLANLRCRFPSVSLVSFASPDARTTDLIAIFASFPNLAEFRWVLERNLYEDDFVEFRLSASRAISAPASLRRVFITEDLGVAQIRTLFGQADDLVVSFRGDKQRGRIDDERADASVDAFLSPAGATVAQLGWHRVSCTLHEDLDLEMPISSSDLVSTSAYISLDGRCVGVDISPTRLNLVLRKWADLAALEHIESLCLPLSIWQRVVVTCVTLPRLRRLNIIISALCCLIVPHPQYHHDYLEVTQPMGDGDNARYGIDDGPRPDLAAFNAANNQTLDARGPSYSFHLERSFSNYVQENDLILTGKSGLPTLSTIRSPVAALALKVLRVERTDDADVNTELSANDFGLFLERLIPSGHILSRLELGGGLKLSVLGRERVEACANTVCRDNSYSRLPEACRPWYFQMPHKFD